MVSAVSPEQKGAKQAILEYTLLDKMDDLSLLAIQLQTGRSHQIRVQLSATGCPLYGDQKYGQQVNRPGEQIALWAHSLRFKHPTKDDIINIEAPPPKVYPWHLWPSLYEA